MAQAVATNISKIWKEDYCGPTSWLRSIWRSKPTNTRSIMTEKSGAPNWNLETWSWSRSLDSKEKTRSKIDGRMRYEVLESCHSSPIVFRIRKEDGTGKIRVLHRNLLLPLRTRIMDGEPSPQPEELDNSSQAGNQEEPTLESQEDSSEDEQDSQSISEYGDDSSVPTRPWTRSQGPPPALVGTQSLSKCSLQAPPTLLLQQERVPSEAPEGYTGRLVG